jgi:tetratricopeptide (TPR) repeat protein
MAGAAYTPAFAQEDTRQFSKASGDVIISRTMHFADEEEYEAALKELRALIKKGGLAAYERATIHQMIGQYSYELGRAGEAQRAFENALQHPDGLLPREIDNLNLVIAQLMIGNGQYREGAERLETYLVDGGEEKAQYVELLVNGWIQAEDYERALPWAKKWFDLAAPKQRKHYDLLNFLYNNLATPEEQLRVVKEMIDEWPEDRNLWDSWASILASSGRESEAFEVHKMMYQAGLLNTERDLLRIVQYHDFYDMPFQGAEILEKEIRDGRVSETSDNLKRLAALFRQARAPERSLPYLKKAAEISDGLELQAELGEALVEAGACKKSETAFETAVKRGYDTGKASMLIGNCYVDQYQNMDQLSCSMTEDQRAEAPFTVSRFAALNAFKAVPKKSRESGNAQKWIQFIEAEVQADERRCNRGWRNVPKELCYQKIKQAYDAMIFTGEFKLEDETCEKQIADYNAEFRIGAGSK